MGKHILNLILDPSSGRHQVHKNECSHAPKHGYVKSLGNHKNCHTAIKQARNEFPGKKIDGCFYCCPKGHKK